MVHVVVPEGVDDPFLVSGGNVYDVALCRGLTDLGWNVRMLRCASGDRATTAVLSRLPDGAVVLIDGLLAVEAPDAVERESGRLRVVVLAHMIAASVAPEHERAAAAERERRALDAAAGVVTTSRWTRDELVSEGLSHPDRIVVARPGVEQAPATVASQGGTRLLCVGAVAPHKGQDVLLRALAGLDDRQNWTCTFAGSLDVDPDFVAALMTVAEGAGLGERIRFAGVLTGSLLADAYAAADLLVAPSRAESFGMAVAEALAHGIPVLASRVGGLPEAVEGSGAAVLVPPDDPWALRVVLQQWWSDAGRRSALKGEALRARQSAPGWHETAESVATVLSHVTAGQVVHTGSRRRR
jgi:glycosyltransferase involved in cell wall biosynthesis